MSLNNMSDEQIVGFIAENLEKRRLNKKITTENMAKKGGFSSQTFSNFLNQGTNIRVSTLIQILRGLGELDRLEELFKYKELYSPLGSKQKETKRVREKVTRISDKRATWGEDK